ncbi:hypothetical protein [Bradyrhizobium sp. 153]|uniref:hypothetical protein n=1 Tax=Bradyrhizobium sp. 153 TaxID=2782627 RepID=UPI001FFA29C3|nr:hypothetical protein [Bradyrhizobium sp. 153]MCK1665856.1 hypothetical protein [Bradyrhizobium sp. 153]
MNQSTWNDLVKMFKWLMGLIKAPAFADCDSGFGSVGPADFLASKHHVSRSLETRRCCAKLIRTELGNEPIVLKFGLMNYMVHLVFIFGVRGVRHEQFSLTIGKAPRAVQMSAYAGDPVSLFRENRRGVPVNLTEYSAPRKIAGLRGGPSAEHRREDNPTKTEVRHAQR